MDTIGHQILWSYFGPSPKARSATCTDVRKGSGHPIGSYLELATKVAELQFRNRNHVLLFRGQRGDYLNRQNNTMLKPTLFRSNGPKTPGSATIKKRFDLLLRAEHCLVEEYGRQKLLGYDRVQRQRIVRWAILQHYEVCPTPLLDVTHSLRIAASFATIGAAADAFIFVVGLPNLSGGITASAEAGLQTIRLSSVCPPSAVRPHIQEGYLLGEYPEVAAVSQKELYKNYEIDFGRRLIAKFRFDPKSFWKRDIFPVVGEAALYPTEKEDPLFGLALRVKARIGKAA